MAKLSGADIVMEVLLEQGVDTVFGYPGGAALFVYDGLYRYSDKIKHVLTAHEQGAAHAADGYARATGKTGVVFSTSGPGATNLVTGIATAFMDSIPLVAITSNVTSDVIGKDAFQEIYITGVTLPITKHNFFVDRPENLADTLREAFRIASSGRKGPVLVDITKDASAVACEFIKEKKKPAKISRQIPLGELKEIAKVINHAKRPVAYIGGGIIASGAEKELSELLEKVGIPASYTIMAAGVMDPDDPKNLGMIGMHGTVQSNKAVAHADVLIALGTRFSDRVALNTKKFAEQATIIHIDIDKSELNKNVKVEYGLVADVKEALSGLLPLVEKNDHGKWLEQIEKWRPKPRVQKATTTSILPNRLINMVCDKTDKETIYVTDVGQHQMWSAQYVRHKGTRNFITSGGLGTMGYGYGAAIGAQVGKPEKRVIHFTGDGSFHMNLNEACTAVSYSLPIITIIFNNRVLGMVYQWQNLFYEGRLSQTVPGRKTDFVKLAEAFGAKGFRAESLEEFEKVFEAALKEKGPVWIDCIIDPDEKVLPMIPNGGTVSDIIMD